MHLGLFFLSLSVVMKLQNGLNLKSYLKGVKDISWLDTTVSSGSGDISLTTARDIKGSMIKVSGNHNDGKVTAVIGNEASDADSIVSSICYAYLKAHHYNNNTMSDTAAAAVIPIASISRSNLHFRRELDVLLKTIDLELNDLLCIDEVPLSGIHDSNKLSLVLTDHNKLSSTLSPFSSSVIEIVDHHVDSNQYSWVRGISRDIAFDSINSKALVGSTCTLIAERYFQLSDCDSALSAEIATLLMGVISLDTINMDPQAGIGTPRDSSALSRLRSISPHDQYHLFESLRDAKWDPIFWRDLSVMDSLIIDYKLFTIPSAASNPIGISSILQTINDFTTKSDVRLDITQFMKEQSLSMLVVMSFVQTPVPRRELLVITENSQLLEALDRFLMNTTTHNLDCILEESLTSRMQQVLNATNQVAGMAVVEPLLCSIYTQGNSKASRKQVAPLMLAFYESYSK